MDGERYCGGRRQYIERQQVLIPMAWCIQCMYGVQSALTNEASECASKKRVEGADGACSGYAPPMTRDDIVLGY